MVKQELTTSIKNAFHSATAELTGTSDFRDLNRIVSAIAAQYGVSLYASGSVAQFHVEIRKASPTGRMLRVGSFFSADPRPHV